jgi:hypothetical protein
MKSLLFFLSIYFAAMPATSAAVISHDWKTPGDGLLTYDTVNKREWLDLSQTILSSQFPGSTRDERYQYVIGQTAPGGLFEGFSNAKSADVVALAQSAGIITNGQQSPENVPAVTMLGDLLSYTFVSSPTGNGNKGYHGFLSDVGQAPPFARFGAIFVVNVAATPDQAGLRISNNSDLLSSPLSPPPGVFLFRVIPEPWTVFQTVIALGIISASRSARRR